MAPRKEMRTRSENISLNGMLLSSSCLIPEGSAVEVSVGADHLSDTGILLSARGKVIRVHPKDSGDFSVAIRLDGGLSVPVAENLSSRSSMASSTTKTPPLNVPPSRQPVPDRGMHLGSAWHTET